MSERQKQKGNDKPFQTQPRIYTCHHCGSTLNYQRGFTDNANYYTCSKCGVGLYKNDDRYLIYYKCPNPECGTDLKDQDGFDDDIYWTCRLCGKNLVREDEDGSLYRIVEDEDEEQEESPEERTEQGPLDTDPLWSFVRGDYRDDPFRRSDHYIVHPRWRRRGRASKNNPINLKRVVRIIATTIFVGFIFIVLLEFFLSLPVGYPSDMLEGRHYETVIELLEEAGFTHVVPQEIADLDAEDIADDYKVTEVKLGWRTEFSESSICPSNFAVTVTYHTLHTIHAPMSRKEAKGMNYKDVITAFQDAGFLDVTAVPQGNVFLGFLRENGSVIAVSIGDSERFTSDSEFRPDEAVVVKYNAPE